MINLGSRSHYASLRAVATQWLIGQHHGTHIAPCRIIPTGSGMTTGSIVAVVAVMGIAIKPSTAGLRAETGRNYGHYRLPSVPDSAYST